MSPFTITILRLVHILGGAFWFGAALMNTVFLVPSINASGPAGGAVMQQLMQRRLPVYINVAALLTILSGGALYGWRGGLGGETWYSSASGMAYSIGALCAIVAALVGFFIIGRTVGRISALMASPEPDMAQVQKLRVRMSIASKVGVLLIVAATTLMAVARYL